MLTTDYKFGEVYDLDKQVESGADKVHFKHIFENLNGGVSVLAFRMDQALGEHLAPAEVMVYVLEGEMTFNMIDRSVDLKAGEFMLIGEGVPHSVKARTNAKVMLVKVKSDK